MCSPGCECIQCKEDTVSSPCNTFQLHQILRRNLDEHPTINIDCCSQVQHQKHTSSPLCFPDLAGRILKTSPLFFTCSLFINTPYKTKGAVCVQDNYCIALTTGSLSSGLGGATYMYLSDALWQSCGGNTTMQGRQQSVAIQCSLCMTSFHVCKTNETC